MTNYREQVFIDLHKLVSSDGFDPAAGIAEFTEKYFIVPKAGVDMQVDVSSHGEVYFYSDDYTNVTSPNTPLEIDYDGVDTEDALRNAAIWAKIALTLLKQEEVNALAESNRDVLYDNAPTLEPDELRTAAQKLAQQGYVIIKRPEIGGDSLK